MSIAWTTVEAAIKTWIDTATGLTCFWAGQGVPRPTSGPWVSLGDVVLTRFGHDWDRVEDAPGTPDPGEEIVHKVSGTRRMSFVVTVFDAAASGAGRAAAYLDAIMGAIRLPTVAAALNAAGVGVATFGTVNAIGGTYNVARFEPRATVEVVAWLASEVSEVGTYISTVEITDLDSGETRVVDSGV